MMHELSEGERQPVHSSENNVPVKEFRSKWSCETYALLATPQTKIAGKLTSDDVKASEHREKDAKLTSNDLKASEHREKDAKLTSDDLKASEHREKDAKLTSDDLKASEHREKDAKLTSNDHKASEHREKDAKLTSNDHKASEHREKDALILQNRHLRVALSEAHDKLVSLQQRSADTQSHLQQCLETKQSEWEIERETKTRLYEGRFEKIRAHTTSLLQDMKLRYQARMEVLQNKMQLQAKQAEKCLQEVESVWQQRMDEYRDGLTAQFNELVGSVQQFQEDKKKSEESYSEELRTYRTLVNNLQLENRMWKDKHDALQTTSEQYREKSLLLQDQIKCQEEKINTLSLTVKEGIEERRCLEEQWREMREKQKAQEEEGKKSKQVLRSNSDVGCTGGFQGEEHKKDLVPSLQQTQSFVKAKKVKPRVWK